MYLLSNLLYYTHSVSWDWMLLWCMERFITVFPAQNWKKMALTKASMEVICWRKQLEPTKTCMNLHEVDHLISHSAHSGYTNFKVIFGTCDMDKYNQICLSGELHILCYIEQICLQDTHSSKTFISVNLTLYYSLWKDKRHYHQCAGIKCSAGSQAVMNFAN